MFVRMEWRRNEEGRKTVLMREDTRRKCGEFVVVERVNVKGGEERGDDNGMEREWR